MMLTRTDNTLAGKSVDDLELIFDQCFLISHNTTLVGGNSEPLYKPADGWRKRHTVFYTQDYFASALHEIAHWCVAGKDRRLLEDYGYWYAPDGRNIEQQLEFERVEVKPQAMEWLFSNACRFPFRISADNLTLSLGPSESFKSAITEQAIRYSQNGLPSRAERFCQRLADYFGGEYRKWEDYNLEALTNS